MKELKKDTLCLVSGTYLWAIGGEPTINRSQLFYPPGMNSKNQTMPDEKLFEQGWYVISGNFEVIEEPTEFECIMTPDQVCIDTGCRNYRNKYNGSKECTVCTVLISTPTKHEVKK